MNQNSAVRWVAAVVLATAASLPVPFHDSRDSAARDASLVASAQASDIDQSATDLRAQSVKLTRGGHARVASTASALCAGCAGEARAVQVVYASSGGGMVADNVAVAWSSCEECGASALAVQVVAMRHAGDVVATNRALAVNVACTGCATESLAVQYVLVGGDGRNLSARVRRLLDDLSTQLGEDLSLPGPHREHDLAATSASPSTPEANKVRELGEALKDDLGASSVEVRIDARHGPRTQRGTPTGSGSPSP